MCSEKQIPNLSEEEGLNDNSKANISATPCDENNQQTTVKSDEGVEVTLGLVSETSCKYVSVITEHIFMLFHLTIFRHT